MHHDFLMIADSTEFLWQQLANWRPDLPNRSRKSSSAAADGASFPTTPMTVAVHTLIFRPWSRMVCAAHEPLTPPTHPTVNSLTHSSGCSRPRPGGHGDREPGLPAR